MKFAVSVLCFYFVSKLLKFKESFSKVTFILLFTVLVAASFAAPAEEAASVDSLAPKKTEKRGILGGYGYGHGYYGPYGGHYGVGHYGGHGGYGLGYPYAYSSHHQGYFGHHYPYYVGGHGHFY